jgi:hypothetical protein
MSTPSQDEQRAECAEWQARLQRYYDIGGNARKWAIERITKLITPGSQVCDFDDNLPAGCAEELAARWGLKA